MSTYSTNLKIEEIGTGEQAGTWGTTTNDNFQNVFEQAIVGRVTVPFSDADVTLTATNSVASQSFRNVYLNCTGTNTAAKNLIVPTINKNYVVQNNTTGGFSIVVKTTAGTGITVPNGKTVAVYADGTNVIQAFDYIPTVSFGALTVTSLTDTGLTAGRVTYATTGGLLTDDADLTFDGTTLTATRVSTTQVDITAQGDLRLQDTSGGEYVALQAPSVLASSYTLTMPVDDGTNGQALITDGSGNLSWSTAASGDVYGPASATDNAISRFDGTTGKLIQNSLVTISDTGAISAPVDASISGLTVGLGGGAATGNTALGASSLATNSSGTYNTATGLSSLTGNTTGVNNSAFGVGAMQTNTTGGSNTALGMQSLASNTTASNNTAVGYQAGYSNTTGTLTAFGTQALVSNTTGTGNAGFGYYALGSNTTGVQNTSVGYQSLNASSTGSYNTAQGFQALYSNTTASNNTAVGYQAGYSNTTALQNTFIGQGAGYSNTTNGNNTFLGYNAGYANTGYRNTFIGTGNLGGAGSAVTTGFNNTILGGYTGNQGGLDIRTASNYIVLADGDGNPRQVIDSSGNVCIGGTTSFGASNRELSINTASGVAGVSLGVAGALTGFMYSGTSVTALGSYNSAPLTLITANTERMRIDSSGNVGIGTSSPNAALFVAKQSASVTSSIVGVGIGSSTSTASIELFGSASGAGIIDFAPADGTTDFKGRINYDLNSNFFGLFTNGLERMRIDSSGNVGIGTSSPVSKLNVYGSAGTANITMSDTTLGVGYGGQIRGYGNAGLGGALDIGVLDNSIFTRAIRVTEQSNSIQFSTSSTERMRIDPSGNVLIGTTTNTGKLVAALGGGHVFNTEINSSVLGSSNGVLVSNYLNQTTRVAAINFAADSSTDGSLIFGTASSGTLAERMRLTSGGQLGIGKSPASTLDVNGAISLNASMSAAGFNLISNATYNDNSSHNLSGGSPLDNRCFIIHIRDENAQVSSMPVYPNGGGGNAYMWLYLNPSNGLWYRTDTFSTPTITSNTSPAQSWQITFYTGSGVIAIQRTGGSRQYQVVVQELVKN